MLRLDERQRAVIADKLPDMANLVAAAIVIGFSIGEPAATMRMVALTMAVWAAIFIVAVIIRNGCHWRIVPGVRLDCEPHRSQTSARPSLTPRSAAWCLVPVRGARGLLNGQNQPNDPNVRRPERILVDGAIECETCAAAAFQIHEPDIAAVVGSENGDPPPVIRASRSKRASRSPSCAIHLAILPAPIWAVTS